MARIDHHRDQRSRPLPAAASDESRAVDLVRDAGQMSRPDIVMVQGSEANASAHPRRGMTLRFMPTTSVFDRDLAGELYRRIGTADHSLRTLFLMRGQDRSGRNDFAMRS